MFTPYGGSGREAERFLAELAHKVSEKKHVTYVLRSAVLCVRGLRAPRQEFNVDVTEAIISEATGKII